MICVEGGHVPSLTKQASRDRLRTCKWILLVLYILDYFFGSLATARAIGVLTIAYKQCN